MSALQIARLVLGRLVTAVWNSMRWTVQAWRAIAVCVVVGNVLLIAGHDAVGLALMWAVPVTATLRAVWDAVEPRSYDLILGGPIRRAEWRHRARKGWKGIAQRCGLVWPWAGAGRRDVPRLTRVRTHGNALTLAIRTAVGQTVDHLIDAADAIATALEAEAVDSRRVSPGVVELVLTMRELLHEPTTPAIPSVEETDAVTLGRAADGSPWRLTLGGRHTLVVGRSGAGKGSVFWGVAGNLAPAAHAGLVRLWGIDLKGGVEVAVGAGMFSYVAMDEQAALRLLRSLNGHIGARQALTRGHSRSFEPTPGDPVHVLLIDELAVLTGYASRDVVNEAGSLLKRILTQGRALGVIVVAFVQDPRKETVNMRELFTQTIALRVASTSETRMVLGDGYADLAPAHRIDRTMPGAGYVVGNDGAVERVRADFWSDDLIREVASLYPAPPESPTPVETSQTEAPAVDEVVGEGPTTGRKRSPRTPRLPQDHEAA